MPRALQGDVNSEKVQLFQGIKFYTNPLARAPARPWVFTVANIKHYTLRVEPG